MGSAARRSRGRAQPQSVRAEAHRGSAQAAYSPLHYARPLPLRPCCSNSPLSRFVAAAEQHEMLAGIDGLVVTAQMALEIRLLEGKEAVWD